MEEQLPNIPERDEHGFFTGRRFPTFRELTVVLSILVLIFGITYVPDVLRSIHAPSATTEDAPNVSDQTANPYQETFNTIELEAKAVYVYDVKEQKVLFEKNANDTLPLASVTKLMTALVAHELLDPQSSVAIDTRSILEDGDSGFLAGEEFVARDLLDLTLINSSNDGAYALAGAAGGAVFAEGDGARTFVDAMNIRAGDLNLKKTSFKNPTGLDLSETETGAEGSAKDMATLMQYLITTYPDVLEETRTAHTLVANAAGAAHIAENTNKVVADIPGIIASKTGYTELAGGNLVIAFDVGLNHPIIISVLGSSYNGRFADIEKLVAAAINATLE